MDTNYLENNYLTLMGRVTGEKEFSHEIYGEKYYRFNLAIARLSDITDIIPVTASERLFKEESITEGKKILVKGQFRSYNSYDGERNRLVLTVFAKDVEEIKEEEASEDEIDFVKKDKTTNEVCLTGFICKRPVYRQTPFGRDIADLLLAVNRAYNKSDYIPCIAWGRNAKYCDEAPIGTEIKIMGRIQSRPYQKRTADGEVISKVAYEVSIGSLEVVFEPNTREKEETEIVETETKTEEVETVETTEG